MKDGEALWNNNWEKIGSLGEEFGFEWGGRWVDKEDRPHLQITFGFKERELFHRFTQGNTTNGLVNLN